MKRITTTWITSLLLFATSVFAQSDVTVHVTDAGTASAIIGASVELNSTMLPTDGNGDAVFVALVDGSYPYTVTVNCYESGSGTVVVAGGNVIENIALTELTMATVFWNVAETSSMNSFPVAAASISMTNGNNSYTLAYGGFDNFMFE
ncbi:MAG: hypothetical protein K9G46_11195, partial [Flavobacteriales bacterium]|nr:hypothetical protein [Flavobacteriales bacterium]